LPDAVRHTNPTGKISLVSSGDGVLSRRTIPSGICQTFADLVALNAHVSQLPIAETAQDGQTRLVFAMSDDGRDPSISETEKPPADGANHLPNVGRAGIT
jgi:hypothetical protein